MGTRTRILRKKGSEHKSEKEIITQTAVQRNGEIWFS